MKDVSEWRLIGHGEKSTLIKQELLSPNNEEYIMKYPRAFDGRRTNWEDVNEVIAAKIARLLGLPTVDAEIAFRNNNRGCLMKHFIKQFDVDQGETIGSLMYSQFNDQYSNILKSDKRNKSLLYDLINLFEKFVYYDVLKKDFVFINLFDILIGNQDRHPHNWQLLFKDGNVLVGPYYDNGASLGWQLPEESIQGLLNDNDRMEKYFNSTKLKIGLDENTQPRIKVNFLLEYLISDYRDDCLIFLDKISKFDYSEYTEFIEKFPFISDIRKEFLLKFISFRRGKLMHFLEGGKWCGSN